MRTQKPYRASATVVLAVGFVLLILPLRLDGSAIAQPRVGGATEAPTDRTLYVSRVAHPSQVQVLDTVRAGRFDSGRMWTFDYPPTEYFEETYGFTPDAAWFDRARLGALRIPGCTASFVSGSGLVMTNHHCARSHTSAVTRPGENLLDDGFYAERLADERRVDGLYADQLVAIEDVTDEVLAEVQDAQTDAERADARQRGMERARSRVLAAAGGESAGLTVQIIQLYNGARYSAYTFRRYQDVRLVMTPELQLGYFGGDTDNFTYPRYALDMTFFRVYENGRPFQTPDYFRWSSQGAEEGDAVFVIGNPGSTNRLETVAQLEFRRDVQERSLLEWIDSRVAALERYVEEDPSDAVRNQLFSLLNAQKLYRGRVRGLNDEYLMARRRDTERQFREAIETDEELRQRYGDLIDRMRDIQQEKVALGDEYAAFTGLAPTSTLGSTVMRRAMLAARLVDQPATGQAADQLRNQILAIPDQPTNLQAMYLEDRLRAFERYLGDAAGDVDARARTIVEASALSDSASTAQAMAAGTLADDPAVELAASVLDRFSDFQSAMAGLGAQEQEIASQLGRARFAIYGTDIPPDATFSLRVADGVVSGYPYNGTIAPAYTTFYGMYDRHFAFGPDTEWDLPPLWADIPEALDLETPLNIVSTNDIIGGNSGSPLLNRELEVVGLVFDGNIESLPSSFIYVTGTARAVSVDARGMLEALRSVYEADRVVQELETGQLVSQAP